MCNLKKFKVYGGMKEDSMIELLDGGLRNDGHTETFTLRSTLGIPGGKEFPCLFIKIEPLLSWGSNPFNCSIWFVALHGNGDEELVRSCREWYRTYREMEAIRLVLKFLRQMHLDDAFHALKESSSVCLEAPQLSRLYSLIIERGDYAEAEQIVCAGVESGLFDTYLTRQPNIASWSMIEPAMTSDGTPGVRGGHTMCIDPTSQMIYLFGGWDGTHDLGDFWSYDLRANAWHLISRNTAEDGGPCARSCKRLFVFITMPFQWTRLNSRVELFIRNILHPNQATRW